MWNKEKYKKINQKRSYSSKIKLDTHIKCILLIAHNSIWKGIDRLHLEKYNGPLQEADAK
jgi:hypothetical protein